MFFGESTHKFARSRLYIPKRFQADIPRNEEGDLTVVLTPFLSLPDAALSEPVSEGPHPDVESEKCLLAVHPSVLDHKTTLAFFRTVRWTHTLEEIVSRHRIHPSTPLYESRLISSAIVEADELLRVEFERHTHTLSRLTGKEFERFVRDILASCGIDVQANVRIAGAEVDLLLSTKSTDGRNEFLVIECKHYLGSKKKVGISQVLRAIGLREVLRDDHVIRNNVILATTGFSYPAQRAAQSKSVELVEYEEFWRWIIANELFDGRYVHPLLRPVQLSSNGSLRIPDALKNYMDWKSGEELVLVGVVNRFEIWTSSKWKSLQSEAEKHYRRLDEII